MASQKATLLVAVLTYLLWPTAVNGQLSGDLRLVDGSSSSSGRLEVYFFGDWGTVCDDGFDSAEAAVACRQLGFSDYSSYGNVGDSQFNFPEGVGLIWLDDLNCFGSEARLESCSHNGIGSHNCVHREDVALTCFGAMITPNAIPPTTLPGFDLSGAARLVARDGQTSPSLTAGRLEVYYNGQWGTVCDDSFTSSEAEVICQQLGFSAGYLNFGTVGAFGIGFEPASDSTPIWLDSFFCSSGSDSSLNDCTFDNGIGVHNCNHNEDIALFCLGDGALRLTPGTSSGRLEVYYSGVWGTVCDDFFDQTDADVACRQLGYASATSQGSVRELGYSQASFSMQIWLDDLGCTSSDLMLSTCSHRGFGNHNCAHSEDVAVSCSSAEGIGVSGGVVAGIIIGVLAPCCCIGACLVAVCVAVGSGALSSNKSRNRRSTNLSSSAGGTATTSIGGGTEPAAARPYPTQPSAATVPAPMPPQGLATQTVQYQPSAPQEPPPPYPGTQNTYPVQPQPVSIGPEGGMQYSAPGYTPITVQQGNAPYPSAPYQLYAEAPGLPSAPPAPAPAALYSTSLGVAQPPPTTASAPPPVAMASAPPLGPPHQPSVVYQQPQQLQPAGMELQQQYAMPTTTAVSTAQSTVPPYPPNIPGQAVYPNEPIYNPGMAPYPPTTTDVAGGDPNQGYAPPPTKPNE